MRRRHHDVYVAVYVLCVGAVAAVAVSGRDSTSAVWALFLGAFLVGCMSAWPRERPVHKPHNVARSAGALLGFVLLRQLLHRGLRGHHHKP